MVRTAGERLEWSPISETRPREILSELESDLTRVMTDLRYMTAYQVAELMDWREDAARWHLARLERAGFLQGVYVTWRHRRHRVYAPSRHVGALLAASDPDWAGMHEGWQSPADMGVQGQAIPHALDRNLFCQAAVGNAHAWGWPAVWEYQVRPVRTPIAHQRIIPDAVLHVQRHTWYVEIERSWRLSTITSKLVRYAEMYQRSAWGGYERVVPRLLIVADMSSTQRRSFDAWLSHLDVLASHWVVLLPWAELGATWQCWVWSPLGERKQVGWRELHATSPTQAPPGAQRLIVPRRRPVPSDTPWLEN